MDYVPGRLVRAAAVVLTALGGAACDINVGGAGLSIGMASEQATDKWRRSFEIEAGGRFEVINVNGSVQVEPASGNAVEVEAERIARASTVDDAKELLAKTEIAEEVTPNAVTIRTRAPKTWGSSRVEVRYVVKVPPSLRVRAATTNGGVKLLKVGNAIVAETTNGGVSGEELAGAVEASTTNGGIDLDFARVGGDIRAATTNGGVAVTVPRDARLSIEASVTNGGISVGDLPVEVGEHSRRRLQGNLNGGGSRVALETTNGGIRLSGR